MNRGRFVSLAAVVATMLLLLTWTYSLWSPALRRLLPREVRPVIAGPSVPWSEMLTIANREAKKIDKGALLGSNSIRASPADWVESPPTKPSYTDTLEVTFQYLTQSGSQFDVSMQDSAPTSTLRIRTELEDNEDLRGMNKFLYYTDKPRQNEIESLVTSVNITPREAVERTWDEVHKYGQQQGLEDIRIDLMVMGLDTLADELVKWRLVCKRSE